MTSDMSAVGHMVSVAYSASCCTALHACFLSRDKPPYVPLKSKEYFSQAKEKSSFNSDGWFH